MSSSDIRYVQADRVARIRLDRAPLNVITIAMLDDLTAAFSKADQDPSIHLIRLSASGKHFSAGVDVADHVGDKVRIMMTALERLFVTLDGLQTPIVAEVRGSVLGGGLELLLGCDLCLASESAKFGQPEIQLGLLAPPASVLLPRLIGERRALELLLSGQPILADQAESWGLVNRVVKEDELESSADALCETLLRYSGAALGFVRRAVKEAHPLSIPEAHRHVNRLYNEELMQTADAHEGLAAFLEKRRPRWEHR